MLKTAEELSLVYRIPCDLVEIILSKRKLATPTFWEFLFGAQEEMVPYSDEEYRLMLDGARESYHNQHLIGRALPPNDPRAIEIDKFLISKGVAIQFHPHHGMQIVDDPRYKTINAIGQNELSIK